MRKYRRHRHQPHHIYYHKKRLFPRLKHALIATSLIATGIVIGVFWGNQITHFFTGDNQPISATQIPITPLSPSLSPSSPPPLIKDAPSSISKIEHEVMERANAERAKRNIPPLTWDTELATIAKQHSDDMADHLEMFHSSIYEPYAENCWGQDIVYLDAQNIVNAWMGSPEHRTWLLCPDLKHIGVGITSIDYYAYASWTFWRSETTFDDWWYGTGWSGELPPPWLDLTVTISQ